MKKISSPHDKYVKFNLSIKSNAVEFFTSYFPNEILKLTDFDTLEISKNSFVDKELKEYFSDILYTVNIAGSNSYIYILFEHKSYNDSLTIIQTLKYIINIWELHLKQNKVKSKYKIRKLPIVLPVLLYHGKEKFSSGKQLIDNMEGPIKELAQFIPNFELLLYDLSDYSDDELRGNAETITRHISREKGDEVMTLAEKLREEGLREGEKIGLREGEKKGKIEKAQNVLIILAQDKFDLLDKSIIKDINNIETLEILDRLFMKTLSCESLQDFKAMINKAQDAI